MEAAAEAIEPVTEPMDAAVLLTAPVEELAVELPVALMLMLMLELEPVPEVELLLLMACRPGRG